MANLSSSRQKAILRKYARNLKFLMMAVSICLIVWTLPKQAKFRYEIEKGRIWTQADLVSPYNFAVLKTQAEIDSDRKTILATITPIYQLNNDIEGQQLDNFKSDLEVKWHTAGMDDRFKNNYIKTGTDLLQHIYDTGILKLNPKYQQYSADYPITILNKNVGTDKNTADLFTREKALAYCNQELSDRKNIDKSFLLDLVLNRLQSNLVYDEALTSRLEKESIESLSITRG